MHALLHDAAFTPFLSGKPDITLSLLDHFLSEFEHIGDIRIEATKTMIGISNDHKRIAWITQLGKSFIHVVFPFNEPFEHNLCFQKVAQVPGSNQFNHHFRMLYAEDVNDEVRSYMRKAWQL
jgi:hypothetical protein